ncbi:MAG: hypothetical protein ACM31L_03550 [Actinomycetota bacterium]
MLARRGATAAVVGMMGVAMVALAATNPGPQDHRRIVVEHAARRCSESPFVKALCTGIVDFAAGHLAYRDWRLFSTGRLGQMETFGALGAVVVVREG